MPKNWPSAPIEFVTEPGRPDAPMPIRIDHSFGASRTTCWSAAITSLACFHSQVKS